MFTRLTETMSWKGVKRERTFASSMRSFFMLLRTRNYLSSATPLPSLPLPLTAHHSMHPPTVPTSCVRDVTDMSFTTRCADPAHSATSEIYLPTYLSIYLSTYLSTYLLILPFIFSRSSCRFLSRSRNAHSRTSLVVFRSISFTVSPLFLPLSLSLPPTATHLPSSSCLAFSPSFFLFLSV